jgi:hypothetical protein
MNLLSPVASYIAAACVASLDAFVMRATKPFTDNYVDFFRLGFLGSYIIPLILGFLSGIFDNFSDM